LGNKNAEDQSAKTTLQKQFCRKRFTIPFPFLVENIYKFMFCLMQGCDGSVLVNSTSNNQAEKEATPNLTLRGFDFIDRVKSLLEAECPGIVSCADTLALVARDSIVATVRILKKQEQTHFNLSFFFMSKEMD
jgi:hypothetical protein